MTASAYSSSLLIVALKNTDHMSSEHQKAGTITAQAEMEMRLQTQSLAGPLTLESVGNQTDGASHPLHPTPCTH